MYATTILSIAVSDAALAEKMLAENEKIGAHSQPARKTASFWSKFVAGVEERKPFVPASQPCADCGD